MRLICRSNMLRPLAIRRVITRTRPAVLPASENRCVLGPALDQILLELNEQGFAQGISIPDSILGETLEYCSQTRFTSQSDPRRQTFVDLTREENPISPEHRYYHLLNPHEQCEAVRRIAHDPFATEVARRYLGTEPVLANCVIWWSYPPADLERDTAPLEDYAFHFDIDDYKFLKLFLYLNDVDEDNGPHVIIAGAHRRRTIFEKLHRRLTHQQALTRYGDQIRTMTGRRGTGFFEDTFCYHKGARPKKRRLVLQIEYVIQRNS